MRMKRTRWTGLLACAALLCGCALGNPVGSDDGGTASSGPDATVGVEHADANTVPEGTDAADATVLAGRNGFPGDFPEIPDSGGSGAGSPILGFGGDTTTDRAGNRAALVRRPVILLHGNGCHTEHENYGMLHVRDKLLAAGYVNAEIWAPSYLGQEITVAEMPTPHRSNIDDVRRFIDAVIEYLDVHSVDVVAHSLGCGMVNGYMRGLQSDGTFAAGEARIDRVASMVCVGAALYGTGYGLPYDPEFNVWGQWVSSSLQWNGVEDATPFGATTVGEMVGPDSGTIPTTRAFKATSDLDDGSRRVFYVGLWAFGDIVDGNLTNAGGLQGADLNQGFDMPDSMEGVLSAQLARHMNLLHEQVVVDAFLPFLNR